MRVVDNVARQASRTFYLARELLTETGARPGDAADGAKLAELQQRSEVMLAGRRALGLLARAMHSRHVLARKLQQGGFGAAAVEQTLARLAEMGYLDDAGFARLWVRGRVERRNEGRAKVLAGLQRYGISRHDAAAALAAEYPAGVEADLCRQLAAGLLERYRSDPCAGQRIARQLSQRGFPSHLIVAALPGGTFDGGGNG